MLVDPFAGRSPPFLATAGVKLGELLNFPTLPLHFHEIVFSALFFHIICSQVSPILSRYFFPKAYNNLNWRSKLNWDVHVVSLVQSVIINAVALWAIFADEERGTLDYRGRVWGYTGSGAMIQALATGYFLWDLYITALHVDIYGVGMLAHAISALTVYGMGYRPFVNYYSAIFILYELSSPFLNVHWFCDKLALTGSNIQLVNGIILILTFFGSRLVWGNINSVRVFSDIYNVLKFQDTAEGKAWMTAMKVKIAAEGTASGPGSQIWDFAPQRVNPWVAAAYLASNLVLNGLNIFWFGKMISTLRARFEEPWGTKKKGEGIVMGKTLDADGAKSVEVQGVEIKTKSPSATTRRRG